MKYLIHRIIIATITILALSSCNKVYDGREIWRIASTTNFEAALSDGHHWLDQPVQYHETYLYKKQNDDGSESSHWRAISKPEWNGPAFDKAYEEGFEYLVEVKRYRFRQTSVTCAKFLKLISKEEKDSDVSPETILIPWFPD